MVILSNTGGSPGSPVAKNGSVPKPPEGLRTKYAVPESGLNPFTTVTTPSNVMSFPEMVNPILGVPLVYLNFEDVLKAPQVHSQGVRQFRIVIEHSGARVAFPAKKGSRTLPAGWCFNHLFRTALVVVVNAHISLVDMLLTDPALTILGFVAVPEFISSHLIGAETIPPSALARLILALAFSAPGGDALNGTPKNIELVSRRDPIASRAFVQAHSSLRADLADLAFAAGIVAPCLYGWNSCLGGIISCALFAIAAEAIACCTVLRKIIDRHQAFTLRAPLQSEGKVFLGGACLASAIRTSVLSPIDGPCISVTLLAVALESVLALLLLIEFRRRLINPAFGTVFNLGCDELLRINIDASDS